MKSAYFWSESVSEEFSWKPIEGSSVDVTTASLKKTRRPWFEAGGRSARLLVIWRSHRGRCVRVGSSRTGLASQFYASNVEERLQTELSKIETPRSLGRFPEQTKARDGVRRLGQKGAGEGRRRTNLQTRAGVESRGGDAILRRLEMSGDIASQGI